MSGYERPTERGTSPTKTLFFATITRGRYTTVSPSYGTQPELVAWVRAHREEGDEIAAWKRSVRGADYTDERLSTRDEPPADPQRLAALMRELSAMLEKKKRELDRKRAA
jgi:hypothetical protein